MSHKTLFPHMSHEEMRAKLRGEEGRCFVEAFTLLHQPWYSEAKVLPNKYAFSILPEFNLEEAFGTGMLGKKRPDEMIALSFPGIAHAAQHCVNVIIEMKGNSRDLGKMDICKYDGYSDFEYLAVPTDLVCNAVQKASRNPRLGVFDICSGRIYKLAMRQMDISDQRRIFTLSAMLANFLHRPLFAARVLTSIGYLPNALLGLPEIKPEFKFKVTPEKERANKACQRIICDVRKSILQLLNSRLRTPEEQLELFYIVVATFKKMAENVMLSDFKELDWTFPQLCSPLAVEEFLNAVL